MSTSKLARPRRAKSWLDASALTGAAPHVTKTRGQAFASRLAAGVLAASLPAAALLALVTPTPALAQSAVGSVFGTISPGESVTLVDTGTGVKRTLKADSRGQFTFGALPPGVYTVTAGGQTQQVAVKAGEDTPVAFGATVAEVVVRARENNPNAINVHSTESTTVLTASQIDALPVGREVSSVALLAPGASLNVNTNVFGNLVSIGGSSVGENGYYINGFDVTNIRFFTSYAALPFDAVAQEQIKTGGYGAEYGRSLGGVISTVSQRGTNEFHFGGSLEWFPDALNQNSNNVLNKNPGAVASGQKYYVFDSANKADHEGYTLWASGPIIRDHLFVFGLIEGRNDTVDTYGQYNSYYAKDTSPHGMVKVDFYPNDNHHIEYTGIFNKDTQRQINYDSSADYYMTSHGPVLTNQVNTTGGQVHVLKYTGHLTSNFTVSLMGGYLDNSPGNLNPLVADPAGAACPRAYDSTHGGLVKIGCWDISQVTVPDASAAPNRDQREAVRADFEWKLGSHTIRGGIDDERFLSDFRGFSYTGGIYYRYFTSHGRVNGVAVTPGTEYVRSWDYRFSSGSFLVKNSAEYLEDTWQITPTVMLYGGLRLESFNNYNGNHVSFIKAENEIAPRLGFSWDARGDQSLKIFGSAGRYYIPISADTNYRETHAEYVKEQFYYATGYDAQGRPTGLGSQIGTTNFNGSPTPPNPASVASRSLTPMFQDEFILGAQRRFSPNLDLGMRGIYRQVKNGVEDNCSKQPYINWANDHGYGASFDPSVIPTCVILNPGRSATLAFDAGDGFKTHVIDAKYYQLPSYQRNYKALEVFGEWRGAHWKLDGSYVLSATKGNTEGYVNSSLGQDDPAANQDFDNTVFEDGAYGYLTNDHRHTIKLFGTYKPTDEWTLGVNTMIQSGAPISCLGYPPISDPRVGYDHNNLSAYSASSFYCSDSSGNVKLEPRGTFGRYGWLFNADLNVTYRPHVLHDHLSLQMDVFNLFNSQTVTFRQEASQMGGASAPQYDPNFMNVINYQRPRAVHFIARFRF